MTIKQFALSAAIVCALAACSNSHVGQEHVAPAPAPEAQTAPTAAPAPAVAPQTAAPNRAASVAHIVAAAEKATKAVAVGIDAYEIDERGVAGTYEVELIDRTSEYKVHLDAQGRVLSVVSERDLNTLPGSKIGLAQAVDIAQKHSRGYLVEANLERETLNNYYEVKVAADGRPFEVRVDASSGRVLSSHIDYD